MSLAVFRNARKADLLKNPIFLVNRRVSITRICERLARASRPSTNPIDTLSLCSRLDVVSGTAKQAPGPNSRKMTQGRVYHSSLPSCSVPMFSPSRHHQISRTVYRRDSSAFVFFFTLFHWSKSLCITPSNKLSGVRVLNYTKTKTRRADGSLRVEKSD